MKGGQVTHSGGLNLKMGNMMMVISSKVPRKIHASFTTENCGTVISNTYGAPFPSIDIRTCRTLHELSFTMELANAHQNYIHFLTYSKGNTESEDVAKHWRAKAGGKGHLSVARLGHHRVGHPVSHTVT